MRGNTCAAGVASHSAIPLNDVSDASLVQRSAGRSARLNIASADPQRLSAPATPLARLGRAILTWLNKDDDSVALI
jgi:hypothetical protein